MSWASRRSTTRVEDRAYSLLGIFDVNIPLLYGEGEKAFTRLQETIIKVSDDYTIFAWKPPESEVVGPLATSPDAFDDSSDIVCDESFRTDEPITFSSKGIHLQARILERYDYNASEYGILPCRLKNQDSLYAVHLQSVPASKGRFSRVESGRLELIGVDQHSALEQRRICMQFEHRSRKHIPTVSGIAARGNLELARLLLDGGVNPDDKQYQGYSPLAQYVKNGHEDVVRLLLEHGASVSTGWQVRPALLTLALKHGHGSIAKLLLGLNAQLGPTDQDLIIKAAGKSFEDVIAMLLENGASPNQCDSARRTPLSEANANRHERAARLLLQKGADVNHCPNSDCRSILAPHQEKAVWLA